MIWMAAFLTVFVIANLAVMYMWFCQRALERSLSTHREIALFPDVGRAARTNKPSRIYTAPAPVRESTRSSRTITPIASSFVGDTAIATPKAKAATKVKAKAKTTRAATVSAKPKAPAGKAKTVTKTVAKSTSAQKVASTKASEGDDITLISGVGPALAKKLAGAGVTSLKQVSKMSPTKLAKLDAELKLGGRTAGEEWIDQAKELMAGLAPRAKIDQKTVTKK